MVSTSEVLASWRVGAIVCMSIVFILAGITKWNLKANFAHSVQVYTGLTYTRALVVARWLPRIELILGLIILVPLLSSWVAGIICLLILAFLFGTIKAQKSALTECGCFGELIAERPTWLTLGRNVLLLFISLTIVLIKNQNSVSREWIILVALPFLLVLSTWYISEILFSIEN